MIYFDYRVTGPRVTLVILWEGGIELVKDRETGRQIVKGKN